MGWFKRLRAWWSPPPIAATPVATLQSTPPDAHVPQVAPSLDILMATTHILFIDDDTEFKVVDILQTAGWIHTKIAKDIATLDDERILKAGILFVDINGVGKKLGFKDEGLGVALALKNRFPNKRVIIYSAESKAHAFHEAWKKADETLSKNADPYEFQQLVEDFARTVK